MGTVRLLIVTVHTGVSQFRIGEGDQLSCIGRVGDHLLIAGHTGVEHHLTHHGAAVPERFSRKDGAIGQHEMSLT